MNYYDSFGFICYFFSTSLGSIVRKSSSISAKTGVALTFRTEIAVAEAVKDGSITSSPLFIPRAFNAIIKASVPEFTPTA